jgi:hypothetical protein
MSPYAVERKFFFVYVPTGPYLMYVPSSSAVVVILIKPNYFTPTQNKNFRLGHGPA